MGYGNRMMSIKTAMGDARQNISPAHIMHHPMIESGGVYFYDVAKGSFITTDGEVGNSAPSFAVDNAVTFGGRNFSSAVNEAINNREVITEGVLLYYTSADTIPVVSQESNVKLGFSHFEPSNQVLFDIQISTTTGVTTVKANGDPDHGGVGTTLMTLTGDDVLADSEVTLAIKCAIDADTFSYHRNGRPVIVSDSMINPFSQFDVNSQSMIFGPKDQDCYVYGAYHFREFNPSDEEIQEFINWMHTNSRLGVKGGYPAWANKI